jgi:Zn-dependent protease
VNGLRFSRRELRDLAVAWLVLSVAFTAFYFRAPLLALFNGREAEQALGALGLGVAVSVVTVGVGFLLHELAHKVIAVRFGQIAEFRADYNMLFLALMAGFAGFLFAAPGAVYHRGRITKREQGLIALAGPVTNVALAVVFAPLLLFGPGILGVVGALGVGINLLLAGFNMIPFGPLDGKKVLAWNKVVYAATAVPMIAAGVFAVFGPGI